MVTVFGIRHHGPGCARTLRAAFDKLRPDIVLVEGPPDAQEVLPLLTHASMRPPVALLVYAESSPQDAVFYPFTHFSPEWQGLRWALERGIPARFMDLPQSIRLANRPPPSADAGGPPRQGEEDATSPPADSRAPAPNTEHPTPNAELPDLELDPVGALAEAAGYTDRELWWEHQIEQRLDAVGLFEGILEAMAALRSLADQESGVRSQESGGRGQEALLREAFMRQSIRAAGREGFERIAVVCGAWHAPILVDPGPAKEDESVLAGLKKTKTVATWIPWTNSRLSYRSGYGAGVLSPGWYAHLWEAPDRAALRWVSQAARLLRSEDLDASCASVIETVRLADATAALRGLPLPGLSELNEAIQAVLCGGDPTPMALIRERLEIGDRLGEVPRETPTVPLQRDLESEQRRLNLKPSTEIKELRLDLRDVRNRLDRDRSRLLHRLRLLGIDWGTPQRAQGDGTYWEGWQLQWQPEFAVGLVEASIWGNTVAEAAAARARDAADSSPDLPTITELLDRAILAELPEATDHLLNVLQDRSAVAADLRHLMDALPPLARVARYGDVRETRAERIRPVIAALFERVVVGLPAACGSLDDDAAAAMVESLGKAHGSIVLLADGRNGDSPSAEPLGYTVQTPLKRAGGEPGDPDQEPPSGGLVPGSHGDQPVAGGVGPSTPPPAHTSLPSGDWYDALRLLAGNESVHGLVRGRCCRLLLEQRELDDREMERLARLALSPAAPAGQAAAWVEGAVSGSAMLLLHEEGLWLALDRWLVDLSQVTFVAILPLLRRAFSAFQPPERRAMGEKVRLLQGSGLRSQGSGVRGQESAAAAGLIHERANLVLPVLAHILGVELPDTRD